MYTRSVNELYHYGVKGMKWGVRHDYVPKGRRRSKKSQDDKKSEKDNSVEKNKSEKKKFQLTEGQKRAVKIGVIVAGTALAAYGGYKLHKYVANKNSERKALEFIQKMQAAQRDVQATAERRRNDLASRDIDAKLGFLKKKTLGTPEDDLRAINEGMFSKKLGASNNCTFCTTAYELRRRGYDVRANYTETGRSVSHASKFFKNAVVEHDKELIGASSERYFESITKKLAEYGDGARGNFCGSYRDIFGGGGHSIIWEVQGGKVIFRDGQSGDTYSSVKDAIGFFEPGKSDFWRTDNLEIDPDRIGEAVASIGKQRLEKSVMEYDSELANTFRKAVLDYRRKTGTSLNEARQAIASAYDIKGL